MPKIKIRVEQGAVTSIADVPPDVELEILDYDTDKYAKAQLPRMKIEGYATSGEWRAPE
jgi:hypothetical protein